MKSFIFGIVLVVLWALLGLQLWRATFDGKVAGKGGVYGRTKDPCTFWVTAIAYGLVFIFLSCAFVWQSVLFLL